MGDQSSLGWGHEQTLLPAPSSPVAGPQCALGCIGVPRWNRQRPGILRGISTALGKPLCWVTPAKPGTGPAAQHVDMAVLTSTRIGAARREKDQTVLEQYGHSSGCQGQKGKPAETSPLRREQGATRPSKGRAGLAGRAALQGFLPSIVPRSLQPKSICSEGVESHQHRQEALSKKASSVLLRRCNHVRNTKRHRHLQKSRRRL